jgi:effector-binding domain-containing protein
VKLELCYVAKTPPVMFGDSQLWRSAERADRVWRSIPVGKHLKEVPVRYVFVLLFGCALVVFCLSPKLRGAEKAVVGGAAESAVSIGEMRVQTVPGMTYLYVPAETSFSKMGEPIKAGFDKVFAAASENKLMIVRPTMLVYEGGPHVHFDAEKNFKMEIGVIVGDDAKLPDDAAGELKVRKTEAFKCATILYTGGVNQQGKAYEKLIPALTAAGLTPTGEEREMCLYWVGAESSDNVFMMEVGVK